ncbi:MAG: NTP transferase domain-containing protein [Nitrososphaeria archaeon]
MMAGGKSRRLGYDKLTLSACGLPLALIMYIKYSSVVGKPLVATDREHVDGLSFLKFLGASFIVTPGTSYPDDVRFLLDTLREPMLLLSADTFFLRRDHIKRFLSSVKGKSATAAVVKDDRTVLVGLNYVVPEDPEGEIVLLDDPELARSINVMSDLEVFKRCILENGCFFLLQ